MSVNVSTAREMGKLCRWMYNRKRGRTWIKEYKEATWNHAILLLKLEIQKKNRQCNKKKHILPLNVKTNENDVSLTYLVKVKKMY